MLIYSTVPSRRLLRHWGGKHPRSSENSLLLGILEERFGVGQIPSNACPWMNGQVFCLNMSRRYLDVWSKQNISKIPKFENGDIEQLGESRETSYHPGVKRAQLV